MPAADPRAYTLGGRFYSWCTCVAVLVILVLGLRLAEAQPPLSAAPSDPAPSSGSPPASAQPPGSATNATKPPLNSPGVVRLDFENRSGASCPDVATLTRSVSARLGYDPFSNSASDVLLVSIQGEKRGGLRGEIRWGAGVRHGDARSIDSKSGNCVQLMEALALTMSMAIDPLKATDLRATAPPVEPGTPSPSSPVPALPGKSPVEASTPGGPTANTPAATGIPAGGPPPLATTAGVPPTPTLASTPPTPTPTAPPNASPPLPVVLPDAEPPREPEPNRPSTSPSSHWAPRPGVVVGALGTAGFVPSPTIGAQIGLEVGLQQFAIALEGRADLPALAHVERSASSSQASVSGDIAASVALGTLAACLHSGRVAGCAFGRVGRLQAAGKSFQSQANASGFSLIAGAGTRATYDVWRGGPATLRAFIDLDVVFTRNSLEVDGQPVWVLDPPVAGSLGFVMLTSIP